MLDKSLFKSPNLALEEALSRETRQPQVVCPGCNRTVSQQVLKDELYTCARCNYTHKMSARQRIEMIADEGSFRELDLHVVSQDPLAFPGYQDKLQQARQQSGESEAVVTGLCRIGKQPCALFVSEPGFMMGSMGAAVGEKLTRLFELATRRKTSVVGFTISGGARVQEGILSLMQMAKVSAAVRRHADAGLLYVAVLCDATTGGVAASFAMQADIILAEPGALIGFAGPRVIEQTTRQKLPPGFQRAEFQLEKGFVGRLCRRNEQKETLRKLLYMHSEEAS